MLRSCMNCMARVVSAGASRKRGISTQSASRMMRCHDNDRMAQKERGERVAFVGFLGVNLRMSTKYLRKFLVKSGSR